MIVLYAEKKKIEQKYRYMSLMFLFWQYVKNLFNVSFLDFLIFDFENGFRITKKNELY